MNGLAQAQALAQHPLLSELRDIRLPEPVSFWPPAPGWWLLMGVALLGVLAAGLTLRARRRSPRRAALAELRGLETEWAAASDVSRLARGLSALVRRVALVSFGADAVAALHGEEWSHFLSQSGGGAGFSPDLVASLSRAVYGRPDPQAPQAASQWIHATGLWIRENA